MNTDAWKRAKLLIHRALWDPPCIQTRTLKAAPARAFRPFFACMGCNGPQVRFTAALLLGAGEY